MPACLAARLPARLPARPQGSKQRRGIPQYDQPHTLAMGGLEAMEELLPGFKSEVLTQRSPC